MNVAELLNNRVEELAAFSTLLFRKRCRSPEKEGACGRLLTHHTRHPQRVEVVHYRRPSSANVRFTQVKRSAKAYRARAARFAGLVDGNFACQLRVGGDSRKKRILSYAQWCLLLRRRRRFALRRRPTARRRLRLRAMGLRHGRLRFQMCSCALSALDVRTAAARNTEPGPTFRPAGGGRAEVVWLPSHGQLCRRFHYQAAKMRVETCLSAGQSESAPRPYTTVRVAFPTSCWRKQHRVLQRWVARLGAQQPLESKLASQLHHKGRTVLPPPLCLLSERSHTCVWKIQWRQAAGSMSTEEIMRLLIMRSCDTPPSSMWTKCFASNESGRELSMEGWRQCSGSAVHGYMWSAAAKKGESCVSQPSSATLLDSSPSVAVVPVVLLCASPGACTRSDTAFYLLAPMPVYFGPRARRELKVDLVSYWRPCIMSGGELEACTLVEVWCAAGVVSTELLGHAVSGAVWWAQEKVDGAVERWRHMSCVSSTQPMSSAKNSEGELPVVSHRSGASETATKKELFRVFMFPSVSRTAETKQCERFPVHQCAVSVLCISSAPAFVTDSLNHCTVHDQLWRTKRLFRFSRYIFSSLAMLPAIRCWGSRALRDSLRPNLQPCWKMGYSNSVRVIGEEEREMLVRLAGCPSSACVSVGRRASQLAGVARLHLSPSTAHQIVLLKFSASGRRGHQSEGSALLLLKPESAVSPHSVCVSCLRHAGVIVSAPFFSMRFGCRLTYAWVWDQTSWGLLQSRHCAVKLPGRRQEISPEAMGEAEYNEDATGVPVNLALFVSSVGKLTSLLPYLCNSPPDVRTAPGPVMHCGSRKPRRDSSRAALSLKRWRMMESLLCDGEICRPVEVVRLGSLGGW